VKQQKRAKKDWSVPVSADEAARRAAGRKRYHAMRRAAMYERRMDIAAMVELAPRYGLVLSPDDRGFQKRMAEQLEVSAATISRDVAWLHENGHL
jgi:hypothetical protein